MKLSGLPLILILTFLSSEKVFGACSNPSGAERKMIYNADYHTYQFCNGTNWVAIGGVTATPSSYIGDRSSTGVADDSNGDLLLAQQHYLSYTGTLTSLSFYVTTAGGNLRLGVYDNTGPNGQPGNKLAETASFTPTTGWNTANVTTAIDLSPGVYYLAYLPSSNSLAFIKNQGATSYLYSYTFAAMPATFSTTPGTTTSHWSLYATITPKCTSPTRTERTIIYNASSHMYQFCNGSGWIAMGKASGGGGAGCSSPTGKERDIIYNASYNTYQFCNGTNWIKYLGANSIKTPTSSSGYFVMSKSTWNGNLGGISGADAKCLTELTTNTGWRGYADANSRGLLTASKVKALFTTSTVSNNLNPLTTYFFADANDSTKGGASFTTDSSGLGPNDENNWSGNAYFGATYIYWHNRNMGNSKMWGPGPWSTNANCGPTDQWDNATSAYSGATGNTNSSNTGRWYQGGGPTCDTFQHLICFVNP